MKKSMPQAIANLDQMDEHLKIITQALYGAVNQAIPHVKEPPIVDKAIADCQEILDEVMAGKVHEWLN
jgi:hypothetical protein